MLLLPPCLEILSLLPAVRALPSLLHLPLRAGSFCSLAFFGGIGAASKEGILIKGSAYIDTLSTLDTVVFDKHWHTDRGRFLRFCRSPRKPLAKDLRT